MAAPRAPQPPLLLPTDASFRTYEGFVAPSEGGEASSWVRAELQLPSRLKRRGGGDGATDADGQHGKRSRKEEQQQQQPRPGVIVRVVASADLHHHQDDHAASLARELAALTGLCCRGAAAAAEAAAALRPPPSQPPPPPMRFLAALARQLDEAGAWPLLARAPGPCPPPGQEQQQQQPQQEGGAAAGQDASAGEQHAPPWRLELSLRDRRGRAHRALVRLDPRAFPGAPPFLERALDLPLPHGGGQGQQGQQQQQARGGGGGGGGGRAGGAATAAPRTLAQVLALARASVAACEPVWDALEDLDAHCWVLDPPAPAATGKEEEEEGARRGANSGGNGGSVPAPPPPPPPRGGLCCRYRRLALGGHASLHVELAPAQVVSLATVGLRAAAAAQGGALAAAAAAAAAAAPPPAPRVTVLGGGAAVAELQRRWAAFDAKSGWARCGGRLREWLEAGLGIRLPPPPPAAADDDEGAGAGAAAATAAAATALLPARVEADCAICFAYLLPADPGGAAAPEEVPTVACGGCGRKGAARAKGAALLAAAGNGGNGSGGGGCGRAFHRRCISEWLQALPTTARCFGGLRGECPYCGAEVQVGEGGGRGGAGVGR
jgi:hypothetical protein